MHINILSKVKQQKLNEHVYKQKYIVNKKENKTIQYTLAYNDMYSPESEVARNHKQKIRTKLS